MASAEASAKSSYMAPASMAPASSMAAPASASSMAAPASASSMAAAATSSKEFSWSQDQERACERDCNSTVHGYLHRKGGSFRASWSPKVRRAIGSYPEFLWIGSLPDASFSAVLTARPEALTSSRRVLGAGDTAQIIKDGSDVRLYSRHGAEYTEGEA
jgi:hypothetical protein